MHPFLDNLNIPRRNFLASCGMGMGLSALAPLLNGQKGNPMLPKGPHFAPKAKRVIHLFMNGGPSHVDTFDPKPELTKWHGKVLPDENRLSTERKTGAAYQSPFTFKKHGQSGLPVSDLFPHVAKHADDLCVIRSMRADVPNHEPSLMLMNCGEGRLVRPSMGSWITYGLGTENQNLPGFVVIKDTSAMIVNGTRCWGNGFMPATHQGVLLENGPEPIANLKPRASKIKQAEDLKLSFLQSLNQRHLQGRESNSELEARIRSYELAANMQMHAPESVDLEKESPATKNLYGLDQKETKTFGQQCLLARRLVERGVRFVQLYHGAGSKWDSHTNMESNHSRLCQQVDLPIAGLVTDLKARGLLEETLVIWGGEFGRTPMSEKGDGRDHNPTGFTMWMAGGGVKGGQVIGETDELGLHAIKDKVHVHDFHATILGLLGLDHTEVVYMHKGRPERVDLNEGHFKRQVLASG